MRITRPSFNTGEVSPRLWDRVDLEKFPAACRELQNFIVLPYGGVNRRPGFEYLGAAGNEGNSVRLLPFNYSTTTAFVLELGNQYMRFWSNGERVESGGSPVQVTTPWQGSEVWDVQFVQVNDVVYLVHPNYAPQKLTRVTDTNWTIATTAWSFPPLEDLNTSTVTMTPSGTSGTVTITASAATFASTMVGRYVALIHNRSDPFVSRVLTADGSSGSLKIRGRATFTTYGTWGAGTVYIEEQVNGAWTTYKSWYSSTSNQQNVSATFDTDNSLGTFRIRYSGTGSSGAIAVLTAEDSALIGFAQITAYTNTTTVTASVKQTFESTNATAVWALSAWDSTTGWPRTVGVHDQRLVFGGTKTQPITLWGSQIGDLQNFEYGSSPSDGFAFTLASTERHLINWLSSQPDSLIVGTSSEEWILRARDDALAMGPPDNIKADRESRYGSKYLQAWVANDRLMFIQRIGRKMREFSYSFTSDSWESQDVTLLAEHISAGDFKQVVFEQQPDGIVWAVKSNSADLVGMTYERNQQVYGWHRQVTQGIFESVCVIYGESSDEVWVVVRRTINGSQRRYIERLDTEYLESLENEDKSRWFYVDSGLRIDLGAGNETQTLTGLGHLEGKTVQILADGNVMPDQVVTSGAVTIPVQARVWVVGLGYTSCLRPVGIEVAQDDGTSQGRRFRVHELVLRLYKSLGGQYEGQGGEWYDILSRDTDDPMDSSPPAFTGSKIVSVGGSYQYTAEMAVRQEQPLPFTLLAMIPKLSIYGE